MHGLFKKEAHDITRFIKNPAKVLLATEVAQAAGE
jgi:hypothetical protein